MSGLGQVESTIPLWVTLGRATQVARDEESFRQAKINRIEPPTGAEILVKAEV